MTREEIRLGCLQAAVSLLAEAPAPAATWVVTELADKLFAWVTSPALRSYPPPIHVRDALPLKD